MNGTRRGRLMAALAVAALQIGLLSWMIAGRAAILRGGDEIMLEVLPVDPRDLLRGDYVVLGTNISSVPAELFEERPGETEEARERRVYVRLSEAEDGIWRPVAARYGEPPAAELAAGEIDIRGSSDAVWYDATTQIPVTYGIERYYVPEGEGRRIEEGIGERSFRLVVAVAGGGAAQIKALYDGDTLLYEEPLF